jgi:hypothetical protein
LDPQPLRSQDQAVRGLSGRTQFLADLRGLRQVVNEPDLDVVDRFMAAP